MNYDFDELIKRRGTALNGTSNGMPANSLPKT